jgi:hypothetical protein
MISRKNFILTTLTGTAGSLLLPKLLNGQTAAARPPKGDPLDKTVVKEFVTVAHTNFDKLKTMLEETPDLLNAVHNLGGWDWEDAIGAAGHMGNREMALFLLDKGARPTICVAAMLGELKLVKDFIKAFPHMKDAVGPHQISLIRHAKAGGAPAEKVLKYLQSIGAKE